jgi:hypothetical protein
MFPPLPESNESEYDRFRRFAQALLAVPKAEATPKEAPAKLAAERQMIDAKLADVRRGLVKRKSKEKPSSRS